MTKITDFSRATPRRAALALATSVFLVVGGGAATAAAPSADQPPPDTALGLQDRVDRIVEAGAPGAALVLRDGGEPEAAAAGLADVATGRELRPSDRFRVGSITKSFVSTVVLQLVETGDLELDATVATYLPGLLPDGEDITLRQLLNHTSGLFNYVEDPEFYVRALAGDAFRPRELVAYSTSHSLLFPPGTDWSYSNTNFVVLGMLVRQAGEQGVRGQIVERITEPLGLDATSFPVYNKNIRGSHAHGYEDDGGLYDVTTHFSPSWAWAAGALISTPSDLSVFYRALLTGELVSPALLAEMMDGVPTGERTTYGLGIESVELPCGTAWGHGGDVPGYHAMAWSTADGSRQAVATVNIGAPGSVRLAVADAVIRTLCGDDTAPSGAALPPDRAWWLAVDGPAANQVGLGARFTKVAS